MARDVLEVLRELSRGSSHEGLSARSFKAWWAEIIKSAPDAFAVTSVLLQESGAYRLAVSPPEAWPPVGWAKSIRERADEWWKWVIDGAPARSRPRRLVKLGETLAEEGGTEISAIADRWTLAQALLELHAIADEACWGFGLPPDADEDRDEVWERYRTSANLFLGRRDTLSSFSVDRIRVLPKMRTPQAGISLRSLSGNLAVVRFAEVDVRWSFAQAINHQKSSINLLLLPVPLDVQPGNFSPAPTSLPNLDDRFGFFQFEPRALDLHYVERMLRSAAASAGGVDGVVLPELAVTESEFDELKLVCERVCGDIGRPVPFLLAGVRSKRANVASFAVHAGAPGEWRRYSQAKHHRWCLDRSQITNYRIGAALHPSVRWWEDIAIEPRRLQVFVANSWLGICPLICEDLARQDPMSHIIRSLGPTLVIALLLDGPQLTDRWPTRYASVLADDPGSSVLTFTPLGMAVRSVPPGKAPRRVVGLWKDAKTGVQELTLREDASGLLVTLCNEWAVEWMADGRSDDGSAAELYLGNIEQLT